MAKSGTTNSSNSSYNILSNNENLESVRKKLIDGIKIDLLDTLKMDDMMVDRNELANAINDNRRDNFVGHPIIDKLKLNNSHPVVKEDDYKDILDEYDSLIAEKEANNWPDDHAEFNKKLRELDTRLAERVILDNGLAIQFKSDAPFEDGKNAEEESKIAYENLNKMELNGIKKYEGKIDWISEQKDGTNYFIIKRKPEELALIKAALKAIDAVSAMKDEDIETLKAENKKNSDTITDLTQRIEELEKNKKIEDEKKQKEIAELKEKYDKLEREKQKELTDTDGENEESTNQENTTTETENTPIKKEETSTETESTSTENEDTPAKSENTPDKTTEEIENGITEERIRQLIEEQIKKYLPPLQDTKEKSENKESNNKTKESNRESVETNALYVSRHDVEQSIFASRISSEFPVGKIEIKGTYVNVEEFEFYEEIKQEYILARGDVIKLAELDKKLAELIILSSPRGVAVEQRYQIRLTEEEIVAGGLVVSQDFLARYGLAVYHYDYTNTIIQREYQERIETVRQIEIEISELTKVIAELTTRINIEKYSSEKILEEIRVKKERVRILRERLYALLISLRKTGNGGKEGIDPDLLALKDKEKRLMDELDELKKKKQHQEEVNNRIKELKEKMWDHESWNKMRGLMNEKDLAKKTLNQLETEEADLAKAEKEKEEKLAQLASDFAPEEINRLTNEYYEIQKNRAKKQEEIKKLQDRIAEINKEIENNPSYEKWQEISNILESMADDQTISIITHDGKKCSLSKQGDYFDKKHNQTGLFDGERPNKDKLLMALDTDKIAKLVIGESSTNPQEILLGDDPKLKEELAKLEAEQAGFDKDIDQKIADKEKELADIRKQIEEKELKEKKRVVVAEFDDGDKGANFHDYCEKNGIKRKDGKEISLIGGMDTDAIYVDKDGRELKLEWINGGASDDGYDNPVAHYELVYYEELKEKKRVVVAEFDDGDKGANFHDYCEKNGIKRKDGKEISLIGGMDTDAIYVDKDGRELKLEWINGGASDDGYDNPVAHYELVYYEETESTGEGTSEIEQELLIIIHEQKELYMELEELEHKLTIEKSEVIKSEIETQIRIIQEKLTTINKKITEFTNITKTYKETITQHKYRVYRVRPIPIPDWQESFEMDAVISDMGRDVFREKASLKVEEDLKAYYKSLGRWQVGSRLALFLGRGRRRKRMIRNEMNGMANTAFQRGAGYATLNDQSQNAADRHKHELDNNMEAINQIARVHNQQVDQLCRDYLNNRITDDQFQDQFNQIIANDANIQNILNGQNITHIGTNILLRLQEQKALNQLILNMDAQLAQYVTTGSQVYMDNMRNFVSQYIKDYQKTPAFMANFEQFVKGDLNARNRLRLYLNHQKQVMQMQITNLRMNIDILNKGKSAYQIDNKDREEGKGSWKFKLGHFMDKHPRGTAIASTAISVGIGLGTGLIASPVVAGWASLGLFGALVGTTNAVKKWTHHTKEQNTHEKNVATDYRNEQAKIQAWQNQALHGHGWRKYKAKRQLALYDQTTQENIKLSDQITEYITNLSSKVGPLTADEDNFMRCNLIEGWARLKYYRQMGHNFLASEQVDSTEKDMKRLEKAITLGLQKIGQTTNNIEHGMTATNQLGTNITYDVIQNDLKASYDKSLIQFKRERRNLSLKYGIGTALASIGVGAFFQWITHSGIFAGPDVPPTAPTPASGGETTSYAGGVDNFALGGDNISNGHVYTSTKSAITGSGAPTGSELTFNYGVGTDGTGVLSPFASSPKQIALNADFGNAALYPNLSGPQVSALQAEASRITTDPLFISAFKDAELARMRALEDLEHFARGLNDSCGGVGRPDLILKFNHTGSIPGSTYNTLPERFMKGAIDITTPVVPGTPGDPGRKAVRRGRWFMGLPLFFNTFKDRKETTDTTDQNFGRGNNQQQNRPNNQQPNQQQANPNQPNNP